MLLQQLQKTTDEIELLVKAKKTEFIYYNHFTLSTLNH